MPAEYVEATKILSEKVKDDTRALQSLIEEIEAIEWYHQRADVCTNESLKAILLHNRNEEMEHATMLFEWLRRNMDHLDEPMKTYLFTKKSVVEIEAEQGEAKNEDSNSGSLNLGALK
ncbi:MAG: ferritin-like domain-containing protein [Cetobacterium sp.]|uniref:ferritin-like domain-containing protein n=1 Tax=Cetobacterium sp. TaxID=2071632 RepID=UPI002FC928F5